MPESPAPARSTGGRCARLDDVVTRVRRAYEEYEFHLVYHALVDFCGSDLSAVYFDILKDRLYTWKPAATRAGARRPCSTESSSTSPGCSRP